MCFKMIAENIRNVLTNDKPARWCVGCGEALIDDEQRTGCCARCGEDMYWSVFDEDGESIVFNGINSRTKKDALKGAWQMWTHGSQQEFTDDELEDFYDDVEEQLRSIGYVVFAHEKKIDVN